jgi:hypothetical protein
MNWPMNWKKPSKRPLLPKAKTKINHIFGKKIPIRAGMGIFVYC